MEKTRRVWGRVVSFTRAVFCSVFPSVKHWNVVCELGVFWVFLVVNSELGRVWGVIKLGRLNWKENLEWVIDGLSQVLFVLLK